VLDLETVYFDDVDVILNEHEAYGIIKLIRQNEKGKLNGKKL